MFCVDKDDNGFHNCLMTLIVVLVFSVMFMVIVSTVVRDHIAATNIKDSQTMCFYVANAVEPIQDRIKAMDICSKMQSTSM